MSSHQVCAPEDHDWQPVPLFGARYRCSLCKVFGFVERIGNDGCKGTMRIVPYACAVKGCGAPAMAKEGKEPWSATKTWRCRDHRAPWAQKLVDETGSKR